MRDIYDIVDLCHDLSDYNRMVIGYQEDVDRYKGSLEDLKFLSRLATNEHAIMDLNRLIEEQEWSLRSWKCHLRDIKVMIASVKKKIKEIA